MNTALNVSLARLWVHEITHSSYKAVIRPRMICNEDVGENLTNQKSSSLYHIFLQFPNCK